MQHMTKSNAVGRRKTAVARALLVSGSGKITINKKPLDTYFPIEMLRREVMLPFEVTESTGKYDARINVDGGGSTGQAGAVKLAIARALVEMNADNKGALRTAGLMTRDPRMVERKKYGQKKARKRFQFSKR